MVQIGITGDLKDPVENKREKYQPAQIGQHKTVYGALNANYDKSIQLNSAGGKIVESSAPDKAAART